ncbi:hypothetical protein ES705_44974 [subsurface metagenome]
MKKFYIPLASIIAICILTTVALLNGINGTVLASALILLAVLSVFTRANTIHKQ